MDHSEKCYREDMAEAAGLKSVKSLSGAKLPPPDGHEMDAGHARPFWLPATRDRWLAERPGRRWRAAYPERYGTLHIADDTARDVT